MSESTPQFPPSSPEEVVEEIHYKITKLAFRNRFTLSEKISIVNTKKTDPVVEVLFDDLLVSTYIDLERQDLHDGVAYLVSISVLTQQRADEILSLTISEVERWNG